MNATNLDEAIQRLGGAVIANEVDEMSAAEKQDLLEELTEAADGEIDANADAEDFTAAGGSFRSYMAQSTDADNDEDEVTTNADEQSGCGGAFAAYREAGR